MGEHLLQLFQQLEPFTGTDGATQEASFLIASMRSQLLGEYWRSLADALDCSAAEAAVIETVISPDSDEPDDEGDVQDEDEPTAVFVAAWLKTVTSATLALLLTKALSLECADGPQLAMDLRYLENVFGALGVSFSLINVLITALLKADSQAEFMHPRSSADSIIRRIVERLVRKCGRPAKDTAGPSE